MSEEARQVIIGELKDRATAKKVEGTRMAEEPLRQSWLSKVRGDALGFVIWGGNFPYEAFQLPTQAQPAASEIRLLGLGVGNHEPFVQNRLRSFGIEDLYQSFYTREDIFLIGNDSNNKLLVQYIQEHYQTRVEVTTVFKGMTFTVSKVRKLL